MKALFIGHDHVADPGAVGARLRELSIEIDHRTVVPARRHTTPWVDFDYPRPGDHDIVVSAGAPWPTEQISSWSDREVQFLRECHDGDIPVLGICFGAQLLARALGGSSAPSQTEIGWGTVTSSEESIVPSGTWFQWHSDTIHMPDQTVIAHNPVGIQAFRSGSSLGVQFHPEMNEHVLGAWFSTGEPSDPAVAHRLRRDTVSHQDDAARRARVIVDHVVSHAKDRSS